MCCSPFLISLSLCHTGAPKRVVLACCFPWAWRRQGDRGFQDTAQPSLLGLASERWGLLRQMGKLGMQRTGGEQSTISAALRMGVSDPQDGHTTQTPAGVNCTAGLCREHFLMCVWGTCRALFWTNFDSFLSLSDRPVHGSR